MGCNTAMTESTETLEALYTSAFILWLGNQTSLGFKLFQLAESRGGNELMVYHRLRCLEEMKHLL